MGASACRAAVKSPSLFLSSWFPRPGPAGREEEPTAAVQCLWDSLLHQPRLCHLSSAFPTLSPCLRMVLPQTFPSQLLLGLRFTVSNKLSE